MQEYLIKLPGRMTGQSADRGGVGGGGAGSASTNSLHPDRLGKLRVRPLNTSITDKDRDYIATDIAGVDNVSREKERDKFVNTLEDESMGRVRINLRYAECASENRQFYF